MFIECQTCKETISISTAFDHFNQHQNGGTMIICPLCNGFYLKPAFVDHLKDSHTDKILNSLESKNTTVHKTSKILIPCPICYNKVEFIKMANHLNKKHSYKQYNYYRCPICVNKTYQLCDFLDHCVEHFPILKKHMPYKPEELNISISINSVFSIKDWNELENNARFKEYLAGFVISTPM